MNGNRAMQDRHSARCDTAVISGVSVFVNSYAVKALPDPAVFTTLKNGAAALVLVAVALPAAARTSAGRCPFRAARPRLADAHRHRWRQHPVPALLHRAVARQRAECRVHPQDTLRLGRAPGRAVPRRAARLGSRSPLSACCLASQLLIVPPTGVSWGIGETMIAAATLLWAVEVVLAKRLLGARRPARGGRRTAWDRAYRARRLSRRQRQARARDRITRRRAMDVGRSDRRAARWLRRHMVLAHFSVHPRRSSRACSSSLRRSRRCSTSAVNGRVPGVCRSPAMASSPSARVVARHHRLAARPADRRRQVARADLLRLKEIRRDGCRARPLRALCVRTEQARLLRSRTTRAELFGEATRDGDHVCPAPPGGAVRGRVPVPAADRTRERVGGSPRRARR